jgi:hypothetical protein
MATTELFTPRRAPTPPEPWSDAHRNARPAAFAEPSLGEFVGETDSLLGAVPLYGPPVIVLAAPWLLLSLMLVGPFALMVTLVVALFAVAVLVGLIGAILAAPYLLVRHLRASRAAHAPLRAAAPQFVVGASR